jgi:hypothetical protein
MSIPVIEPEIQRYFDILGLPPTASEREIREARNFVTKAFHPDKYAAGSKDQARAHAKQVEINQAYEQLLNWLRHQHGAQDLASGAATAPQAASWQQRFGTNNRQRVVSALKIVVTIFLAVEWILTIASWFPGTPLWRSQDVGENLIMIALLVLSSLGAVWFMLAPEAKHMIERWTNDS